MTKIESKARGSAWRLAPWGGAGLLLATPLVAMRFTSEVQWSGFDFVLMGVMLAVPLSLFELTLLLTGNLAYRAGVALTLLTTFLLVWVNLAVGFIGDEDSPVNLMYAGVLAIGIVGAMISRFRAGGMAVTVLAVATAQATAGLIAFAARLDNVLIPTAVFVALWLGAAWLFRAAGRGARADATCHGQALPLD